MLKKKIYYALMIFNALVFVASMAYIVNYLFDSSKEGNEYDELINLKESIQAAMPSTSPTEQTRPTVPGETGSALPESINPIKPDKVTMLPEYVPFYQMNNHLVGWINIPGTKINYPVVQSPETPDYYLKYNFNKERSDWGAIYVRERCNVLTPSDNVTIYGHHKKDGSMFSGLMNYRSKSFWQSNKTFTFDTLYEHHTYEIFAVFKTSGEYGKGFSYHLFVDAENEEEFNSFVSKVKSLSFYETGITAVYGDKLVCLSTCEYTLTNGRLVVVAKRIK